MNKPCYYCEGEGSFWDAHINRKRRCPVCKGGGIEPDGPDSVECDEHGREVKE